MRLLYLPLVYLFLMSFTFVNYHPDEEQRLKFLYIKNFIKNIEWPNNSNRKEFKIGILGDKNVYNKISMINIRPEHANGSNIAYYYFENAESLLNCHMVYVTNKKSAILPSVVKHYQDQAVLIITETDKGCERGSMINFFTNNSGKISFEYNSEAFKNSGLMFSSNFMEQGKRINSIQ